MTPPPPSRLPPEIQGRALRVLVVEHSVADVELCLAELRRAGLQVTADTAATAEELRRCLASATYDVILADYNLHAWTGMDALALVQQSHPHIPFILVTGSLGEESAVEAIKLGAADYILKDRLARLPVAVLQALEDKRLREEAGRSAQALREKEERFRLLFQSNPHPMWVYDRETLEFLEVNEAAVAVYGYTRDEFLRLRITDIRPAEDVPGLLERLRAPRPAHVQTGPVRHRTKDGRVRQVEVRSHAIQFGARPASLVVAQDVTERVAAEERIRIQAAALEAAANAILIAGREGSILWVNAAFTRLTGYAPDEVVGQNPRLLSAGLHPPEFYRSMWENILAGRVWHGQLTNRRKDGTLFTEEMTITPVRDPATGAISHFIAIKQDITERLQAEAVRNRLAAILEATPDFVGTTDAEGRALYVNRAGRRMVGLGEDDDISGMRIPDFHPPWAARLVLEEAIPAAIRDGIWQGEAALLSAAGGDGREIPISQVVIVHKDPSGNVRFLSTVARDITESKRAEAALRASEARYRALFENAAHGIYHSLPDGRILAANPAMVAMLGCDSVDQVLQLNLAREVYCRPEDRDVLVEQCMRSGRIEGFEVEWKRADGRKIAVRLSARAVRDARGELEALEAIAEDVTERRTLERQLRAAQKFEAIGQLAGGIAHDFNNVLGAILGWAELAMMETSPDHPLYEHLSKIRDQGDRAAGLTRQLLAFARRQILAPRNIDLNHVIRDTVRLLEKVIGTDIELRLDLREELHPALADPTQVEQVLMNLCLNARDAMPHGGRLTIQTSNVEFDDAYCRIHEHARPGHFVLLAVSDTGQGMDPATLEHIFEPFFTTKEIGKGTGLGLATVYGIVKQHNGFLHVYSEPSQGSTFRVYLPVGGGMAEQAQRSQAVPARGGTETILLAEDHDGLRELARETLERHGYRVLTATDGEQALALFRQHQQEIALLVFDVVLPRLNGPDAYTRIAALRPGVPVLFMTGYTSDAPALSALASAHAAILQKPYNPEDLARQVREVLDRVAQN